MSGKGGNKNLSVKVALENKSKIVSKDLDSEEISSEESDESVESGSEDEGSGSDIDESVVDSEDEDSDFEKQSSSDENESDSSDVEESDVEGELKVRVAESALRSWNEVGIERSNSLEKAKQDGSLQTQQFLHLDDLSSDDEEGTGNTIGRVPLHWYDAYDHIGYNIAGEKIAKRAGKDRIDIALSNQDDSASRRTVYDMYNDKEVVLSERDLEIIRRIQAGAFAHPEHNDTPDYIDYFSSIKEEMPISSAPEPKRRFLPSKWELMNVMKIVKAMKEGRYVDIKARRAKKLEDNKGVYMIWNDLEDEIIAESKRHQYHLPAPKLPLPGHAESYNPPDEYLLTKEEIARIEDMDPSDRPLDFIPKKHSCLRHVAGYNNFIKERFERCLDLYLCPRKLKKRLNIDPEALVPRLPKPRDLKPFPNSLCLQFLGHKKAVRSISLSPDGQYIASGSDDGTVKVWEVDTCLCRYSWDLTTIAGGEEGGVVHVAWNPNASHHLLAAVVGAKMFLITTGTGDADASEITEALITTLDNEVTSDNSADSKLGGNKLGDNSDSEDEEEDNEEDNEEEDMKKKNSPLSSSAKAKSVVKWTKAKSVADEVVLKHGCVVGPRYVMQVQGDIGSVAWHHKGDYIATMSPSLGAQAVFIHQLSKGKSQCPFNKSPGKIQSVCFHPSRPFLFVVTQQHVKVYHLIEQKLVKRLLSGCKWLSSIDVHPSGDHVIVGSFDRRVVWFDLDLSSSPYKTLKFHEKAVRSVSFHKRYPLMASAADDGTVHVFHAMTYSDLLRNAMIVPLKILRGHGVKGDLGVLKIAFHPKQPWIFSAGADGVINLYQDI